MKNDKRVYVYRNLHFRDEVMYSIKSMETNRVVDHLSLVYLEDVTFKVSEAGRQRVLSEGRKNVHAGVMGTPKNIGLNWLGNEWVKVTYNPYKYKTFIRCDTMEPVLKAKEVMITQGGVFAYDVK